MDFSQFSKATFWKLAKIFQNFPTIWDFAQTREKVTHALLKLLEKNAKIMGFSKFA